MAKRRERSPSASAREATAVFTDSTVTNAPAQKEISEIKPLRTTRNAPSIFSELRTPEHRLSAKKQLIRGTNSLADRIFSPCASPSSSVLVDTPVRLLPDTVRMTKNAGKNANTKSAQMPMVAQQRDTVSAHWAAISAAMTKAEAVE